MKHQDKEKNDSLKWDINASMLKIKESEVTLLPVNKLSPHPDNRPLGPNLERIKQLKTLIANDGFDSSHPLVVRPYMNGYQIIEGEHRFNAAKSLGYLKLPCVIRDLNDTEALIQLVLGNIQTESKPLEIGINALKVVQKAKDGQKGGYNAVEYAKRLGIGETSIRRYMNASESFQFIKNQLPEGTPVLDEVYKLEEIHRCPQSDWLWLHNLIMKNELSKMQVIDISQAIREIKTNNAAVYGLFDFMAIRQEIAQQIIKGDRQYTEIHKELIQTIEKSHESLEVSIQLYEYNVLNDFIQEEVLPLREWFINNLKELKSLTKQNVLEAYKDALQLKRSSSKEEAERTAAYFRDKKNSKEREEQERIEREMRQVKKGEWWQLGVHYLYCGEGTEAEFYQKIPQNVALAFCNPPALPAFSPQNASKGWSLDWMAKKSTTVAVTPPLEKLQDFLRITHMPYKWALSAQLNVKKNEMGLGSWVCVTLFSTRNLDHQIKDSWKIDGSDLQGNKTQDLLTHLVLSFSREKEIVLDMYAGMGVLFMVAEDLNRACYGAEVSPDLCKEIIDKWEDTYGTKARKVIL